MCYLTCVWCKKQSVIDRIAGTEDFIVAPKSGGAPTSSDELTLELLYEQDMQRDMTALRASAADALSDLAFVVNGTRIPVHKFVMARCPPLKV